MPKYQLFCYHLAKEKTKKFMSNLSVFNKNTKKIFEFSKINILFGYSKSGKTTLLSGLNSIFLGKDHNNLVNGTQTVNGDFNVFYLGSKDGIKDHLKLSSKSLVRRMLNDQSFSDDFHHYCDDIIKGINGAQQEIEGVIRQVLPKTKIEIPDATRPLDLLLDNISISLEMDSSTEEKEELFSLVNSLSKMTKNKTIVLIDDFNNDFDEETTIKFFDEIKESNAYFILTSKKPISQHILTNEVQCYAVRHYQMIPIPPLDKLVSLSQEQEENHTFEEYILGNGYLKNSGYAEIIVDNLKNDQISNLLRILTSKKPIISDKNHDGMVTIIPRTDEEKRLYEYIFGLLDIK